MIPLVGFLPADDPRVAGTVAAIEKHLMKDGFVQRYSTRSSVDGLPPGEGVFLPCSFWLVDNRMLQGRQEEAEELFRKLLGLCNDVARASLPPCHLANVPTCQRARGRRPSPSGACAGPALGEAEMPSQQRISGSSSSSTRMPWAVGNTCRHVLMLDLLPPGPQDPHGLHGAVCSYFDTTPYGPPADGPLTLVSYAWDGTEPKAYIEPVAVNQALIEMPLFLTADRYVNVPLEPTYLTAYRGMPEFWRNVIEQGPSGAEPSS